MFKNSMIKNKFFLLIACLVTLLLAGCTTPLYNKYENGVNQTKGLINKDKTQYETPPPVVVKKGLYVDTMPVTVQQTPAWMKPSVSIHGSNLPLSFYVARIMSGTDINVSYGPNTKMDKTFSIDYSGSIKGALSRLAAKTGYSYQVIGKNLSWSDMVSRTFDISFMPGSTKYLVGGQGTSTKNSSNSNAVYFGDLGNTSNEYSNIQANLSVWTDLTRTLNELKSKQGKVVVSQATTSVTVYDHPHNVAMMAKYLKGLNKTLSQEVALQVRVIEVDLNKNFNYGVDWNLLRSGLSGLQVGIKGAVSQPVSLTPIGNNPTPAQAGFILNGLSGNWAGTTVLINALKQQGKVSVSTQPRVITLNNQVAEIGINKLQGYLESVSNTVQGTTGATTESLTPGIVKTGFSLYILPKIKGKNVYLQISSALSRLDDIQRIQANDSATDASGNNIGANAIQVPTVSEKLFNQRSEVSSGDTLVIAGFKQLKNQVANTKVFNKLASQGGDHTDVETIVLITPTILG